MRRSSGAGAAQSASGSFDEADRRYIVKDLKVSQGMRYHLNVHTVEAPAFGTRCMSDRLHLTISILGWLGFFAIVAALIADAFR